MTDGTQTPGQQTTDTVVPGQQATVQAAAATPVVDLSNYVEKARYTGLVQKVDQLTQTIATKDTELAAKSSEIERLNQLLGVKDAEGSAAVAERERQIQSITEANTQITKELDELRAFKSKVDIAMEMNRPDLLRIATQIPIGTDPAQLKTLLTDIAGFAESSVQSREEEIFAGVTTGGGGAGSAPSQPQTPEAWGEYIEKFPLGSPERAKALDAYGDFLEALNK